MLLESVPNEYKGLLLNCPRTIWGGNQLVVGAGRCPSPEDLKTAVITSRVTETVESIEPSDDKAIAQPSAVYVSPVWLSHCATTE